MSDIQHFFSLNVKGVRNYMSDYGKKICRGLRALNNMIMRFIECKGAKKEIDSATGTNGWIIGFISEKNNRGEDVFQRDLEQTFSITRSTASKVVNLMVKKELIERQRVPQDARLKKLVLTPKAQALSKKMCRDGVMLENNLLDGFSDEEKQQMLSFIERMKKNIAI